MQHKKGVSLQQDWLFALVAVGFLSFQFLDSFKKNQQKKPPLPSTLRLREPFQSKILGLCRV